MTGHSKLIFILFLTGACFSSRAESAWISGKDILSQPETEDTMKNKSARDFVTEARQKIEHLTPFQVQQEISSGKAILIDIREAEELAQHGRIEGSVHAPRGMLEFYADPSLPYHKPEFQKDNRLILQCASGGRSALATETLQQMGYHNVAHLDGGLKAWKEAGLPVRG